MTDEQRNILALYGIPGVGAKTFARLTARFISAGAVFDASDRDLLSVEGVGPFFSEISGVLTGMLFYRRRYG